MHTNLRSHIAIRGSEIKQQRQREGGCLSANQQKPFVRSSNSNEKLPRVCLCVREDRCLSCGTASPVRDGAKVTREAHRCSLDTRSCVTITSVTHEHASPFKRYSRSLGSNSFARIADFPGPAIWSAYNSPFRDARKMARTLR